MTLFATCEWMNGRMSPARQLNSVEMVISDVTDLIKAGGGVDDDANLITSPLSSWCCEI